MAIVAWSRVTYSAHLSVGTHSTAAALLPPVGGTEDGSTCLQVCAPPVPWRCLLCLLFGLRLVAASFVLRSIRQSQQHLSTAGWRSAYHMYFTVCLGSSHQALAGILCTSINLAPAGWGSGSICCRRSCRQLTTGNSAALRVLSRHRRHGGVRRTADGECDRGRCPSVAANDSGAAGESLRWAGGKRRYHHQRSTSTTKDDTSLNLPAAAPPASTQGTLQPRHPQHQPPPRVKPKLHRKSPHAVAMDEFAALERKLASPPTRHQQQQAKSKTPEQIAMEEFAFLERKLGSAPGTTAPSGQKNGSRKVPLSSLPKPEVSVGACGKYSSTTVNCTTTTFPDASV